MSDVTTETAWIEVRLHVPLDGPAEIYLASLEAVCLELSPGGFVVEGEDAPPGDHPPPAPGTVRVLLYVEEEQVSAARARLDAALVDYPGATLSSRPLDPDWRERWKRWFKGFTVSPRLGVRPPWEGDPEGMVEGAVVVVIEPGMAFGTGQHETTHLCLSALDALADEAERPMRILDVGCGTGILAIAAARLWEPEVVGIDVDEAALRCAVDNLAPNGVDRLVTLSPTPLADIEARYPLVIANIIAPVLLALADELVAHVTPGGTLWLSGLLETQVTEVTMRYQALGARVIDSAQRGEWVRLRLEVPE
ncbi:MAG: 50S ribosomal protein L11 methyltransferase [Myxococcota bacterium]